MQPVPPSTPRSTAAERASGAGRPAAAAIDTASAAIDTAAIDTAARTAAKIRLYRRRHTFFSIQTQQLCSSHIPYSTSSHTLSGANST